MDIQEGMGWRLVHDRQRQPYSVLIGGADWAVEFREIELITLRRGVITLQEQYRQILPSLMPEEDITLELDLPLAERPDINTGEPFAITSSASGGGQLFIALQGDPGGWALRFVLTPADGARAVEGEWSRQASAALAAALEQLSLASSGPGVNGPD